MSELCSATATSSAGGTAPRTTSSHRSSASSEVTRPVARSTTGW